MRTLKAFCFLTLNGYYKGPEEDTSWHIHGPEGNEYSEQQLAADNLLLFGRKTYEMMHSFWPGEMAKIHFTVVAEKMNTAEKIVISNSLHQADWNHTRILRGNLKENIQALKLSPGKDITILGSGNIVTQLTEHGLIDEYEFLIDPLAIGQGTPLFQNINDTLHLSLTEHKVFRESGAVLLKYKRK